MKPTHAERNRQTRAHWDQFDAHRTRVTQLLIDAANSASVATGSDGQSLRNTHTPATLCVLGAGNCNDLNLPRLSEVFEQVILIDIDGEAMQSGLDRQGRPEHIKTVRADVTQDDISLQQFDVVASTCLLTQLFVDIDPSQPNSETAFAQVRLQHIQKLLQLTKPLGTGILVTDVVSSDTVPDLAKLSTEQLQARLPQLIQQRNFFTGTNPAVIHHLLTADPTIAPQCEKVQPIAPWLWNPGPRTYACYGMQFVRRL